LEEVYRKKVEETRGNIKTQIQKHHDGTRKGKSSPDIE
jgi:hypothetical protein